MKRQSEIRIAVVGTDSLRGKEIKSVLNRKGFHFQKIDFFDPGVEEEYSKLTEFRGEPRVILPLEEDSLVQSDLVFLAAEKKTNKKIGALASKLNFHAIDLNETFNSDMNIPVVVSGINDKVVLDKKPRLVANPHPVTIILSHLFYALATEFGLKKAISFVLQPASAFDESGMQELANQSIDLMNGASLSKNIFKAQVAFNLLSQTEQVDESGFSPVERQIVQEVRRVIGNQGRPFSLSLVQAPVFHTYSIMAYLDLDKKADIQMMEQVFKQSSFFKFIPPSTSCPVSSVKVAGTNEIHVSQIKKEETFPNSFWIWTVADNLTLGSALNAYEVANSLMC
ncbi:MAG: Asd/ArgC dimerization domain-containing protein [Candidatus Aminicenantes bacterium]|jgi:aspartate-semialdehyde dehydrogenase